MLYDPSLLPDVARIGECLAAIQVSRLVCFDFEYGRLCSGHGDTTKDQSRQRDHGRIHCIHPALWGNMTWRILGNQADSSLDYEGGWQNQGSGMHKEFRFVESIKKELDAPGNGFTTRKPTRCFSCRRPG
jgi:hypothetical protein